MDSLDTQRQEGGTNVQDLPDELLLHILTYIREPRTLTHLCKVDRRFSRIATPILYEHYTTPDRDDESDDDYEEEKTDHAGLTDYHFARTLVKRPELRKHVQRLDWYYNTDRPEKLSISLQETSSEIEDEQLNLLLQSEFIAKKNGDFGETCDSLFVAIVLRTANIKQLSLYYENDRRSRRNLILKARRSRLGPVRYLFPDIFQRLKEAEIVLHVLRIDDLAWLMRIKSLERLTVGRILAWQNLTWQLEPKSSNLTELSLFDCKLHWQNLSNIIATCKSLTKLSYPGPQSIRLVHDDDILKLKETLDQHASTLEDLHFDVFFKHVDEYGPDNFGTFFHYERLRELCIYSKYILYTEPVNLLERVPPSLHTLRLTMCSRHAVGRDNVDFLEPVAEAISSAKGNLKNLYFSEDITEYMRCSPWQENQKICASYGLKLRVWEMRIYDTDEWEEPNAG